MSGNKRQTSGNAMHSAKAQAPRGFITPTLIDEKESHELSISLTHRSVRDRALISAMSSGAVIRVATALIGMTYYAISARSLSSAQFGVVATIATFVGFLSFADLGLGSGLMTRLAVLRGRDDVIAARSVITCALLGMLALGGLLILVGVLLAFSLPWNKILGLSPGQEDIRFLRQSILVLFIATGIAVPANIGQRILLALQRGFAANIWLLVTSCLTGVATALVAVLHAPLWCFVGTLVGVPAMVALVQSAWLLGVSYPDLRPRAGSANWSDVVSLARMSSLFFALNLTVTLAFQSDSLIVASTLGASSAAVFAVALRMFGVLTSVLSGASQQLWTALAEAMARNDQTWVRSRFYRVFGINLLVSCVASLCLVLGGRLIANAWVGSSMQAPRSLLIVFGVWTVYSLCMTQISYLLNAAQIIGPQLIMAFLMTVSNILLSLYLVHRIGLTGPLVGSLVSHVIFTGIPSLMITRRLLANPLEIELGEA